MSTARTAPSMAQSLGLVAEREITSKLRSRAFQISTAILLLGALALVLWGSFSANNAATSSDTTPVAVTSQAAPLLHNTTDLDITDAGDDAAAKALVEDGTVDAAVIVDEASPTGYAIVALDEAPMSLTSQLTLNPTVTLLHPDDTNPALRYLVAIGFGVVFLLAAQLFGSTIAASVVEEKSTRVVEILLSSVSSRVMLAGKVLGNTVLAIGQVLALVAVAVIGLSITGQAELLTMLGSAMIWFAIFFLFGFILLAALYAAAASMVSRQEDIGSTTFPLMILIMAPYFLIIFFNDNDNVLGIMSYVPFSAAVGMPMRLFLGTAQWWEPLASLVILLATCVLAIIAGAKIYDNSLLRTGARVSLKEALGR